MEKEGFIRTVDRLEYDFGASIRMISTDRHVQIKKIMNKDERYKHIIHEHDPWHIAKGISKKLVQASKKRG